MLYPYRRDITLLFSTRIIRLFCYGFLSVVLARIAPVIILPLFYKRAPIENPAKLDVNGRPEIVAVRREINSDEAQWVVKIFEWFTNGDSPKKIARKLNDLGVPSARGSTWAANAIYGNFKTGIGLLNNRLYIGRYVWNRSEWVKNPDTGRRKRIKRKEEEWTLKEMPELRIVPQELWDASQRRQQEIRQGSTALREALNNPQSRSHTGKYLFSGLLQCGCCGANYTVYSTTSYACAFNINRGDAACTNRLRLPKKMIEGKLLDVVRQELLSEESVDLFIKEKSNLLREHNQQPKAELMAYRRNMAQAEKQIANLLNAIKAGIITPMTKAELERAEAEYTQAKAAVDAATGTEEVLTATLPQAAKRYKKLVADLKSTLEANTSHARQCLKTLLGTIRLIPSATGRFLEAELRHSPEGLLRLALQDNIGFKVRMVAGTGFEPVTFRL